MKPEKELSRSRALAVKVIYAAMTILKDNGKEMPAKELMEKVEGKVQFDPWDKERYEKSGYIRWRSILHFFSIDCVKAGYLLKKKGIWYITPEGVEALKMGPDKLLNSATDAYRKWKAEEGEKPPVDPGEGNGSEEETITLEQIEQIALERLEKYIYSKNAYEFQDLVAALLRGMGYHTPFIAPKGKDGGIDITAYRDPLGTQSPRMQVQVKHRESSATAQEVRQLIGLLRKEGNVGIFVSSGGFTPDAKVEARSSHVHVELIDLTRFISLWEDYYEKLSDEDKNMLPLIPVFFLAPTIPA